MDGYFHLSTTAAMLLSWMNDAILPLWWALESWADERIDFTPLTAGSKNADTVRRVKSTGEAVWRIALTPRTAWSKAWGMVMSGIVVCWRRGSPREFCSVA